MLITSSSSTVAIRSAVDCRFWKLTRSPTAKAWPLLTVTPSVGVVESVPLNSTAELATELAGLLARAAVAWF